VLVFNQLFIFFESSRVTQRCLRKGNHPVEKNDCVTLFHRVPEIRVCSDDFQKLTFFKYAEI